MLAVGWWEEEEEGAVLNPDAQTSSIFVAFGASIYTKNVVLVVDHGIIQWCVFTGDQRFARDITLRSEQEERRRRSSVGGFSDVIKRSIASELCVA
uniref:Uncharacterized protein n=1 Tax=Parascaris equorum TaxID=6256 RepID=A0A914S0L0_PAREQ